MIGERLAEIRKDHNHTQQELAELLHVSTPAVRAWEQEKSAPSHEMLIAICKLYHVSSDYLLGLSSEDPRYERNITLSRLSKEDLREMADFEAFLLWRKKIRQQQQQDK